jgi:hypothetical protein
MCFPAGQCPERPVHVVLVAPALAEVVRVRDPRNQDVKGAQFNVDRANIALARKNHTP